MANLFVAFNLFLALIFLALPIVYLFLRLENKIGPEDPIIASLLGFVLWVVGMIGFLASLRYAAKLLNLPAP